MEYKNFLLEIGTEEIPASYITNALKTLIDIFSKKLSEAKLEYEELQEFSTPRRMAIIIKKLQAHQNDEKIKRIGPSINVAYDDNGNLTKAGEGFLRGANASKDDIYIEETPKGKYIAVQIFKKGKQSNEILQEIFNEAINKISYPKSMRWGDLSFSFARPIRWILALYDDEILPLNIEDITSSNKTYGNRFQKLKNELIIKKTADYEKILTQSFVIPNREKRKKQLLDKINSLFENNDLELIPNDKLIELSTDITEYPTPILAEFEEKYLILPEKIIILALSEHQKTFSVKDINGNITNKFVCISNGNPEYSDIIKEGNQKVVNARLADALFYFNEDTKEPFENFVEKLSTVTFQEQLGTLREKTDRIIKLTEFIGNQISNFNMDTALRAAKLCKADLVSNMLGEKEFTKLQGYIGKIYAQKSNEDPKVCDAMYEHYFPRGQNDLLPSDIISAVVAISDKIDTICGICGVGMLPTGSNDPFALRRAGNGIVQILDDKNLDININQLIDFSFSLLKDKLESDSAISFVKNFINQRIEWLLKLKGIEYDVIESIVVSKSHSLPEILKKAIDIQSFKQNEDFKKLVIAFKRVSNILAKAKTFDVVDEELLIEADEKHLYNEFNKIKNIVQPMVAQKDFKKAMQNLVIFGKVIDRFFDNVLVNAKETNIKNNRYNLLNEIRGLFLQVADLSKIVTESD